MQVSASSTEDKPPALLIGVGFRLCARYSRLLIYLLALVGISVMVCRDFLWLAVSRFGT
jgi:hypothetical protein